MFFLQNENFEIMNSNLSGRKRADDEEIGIKLTGEENATNENTENVIEIE